MCVIVISGYTSSGKTEIASKLIKSLKCGYFEMSSILFDELEQNQIPVSVLSLVEAAERLRRKHGNEVLAKQAIEKINNTKCQCNLIVGVRSIHDLNYIKKKVKNVFVVYIHSPKNQRRNEMLNDPSSIAKTQLDFEYLDRKELEQGMVDISKFSDFKIINDNSFPQNVDKQIEELIISLKKEINYFTQT